MRSTGCRELCAATRATCEQQERAEAQKTALAEEASLSMRWEPGAREMEGGERVQRLAVAGGPASHGAPAAQGSGGGLCPAAVRRVVEQPAAPRQCRAQ